MNESFNPEVDAALEALLKATQEVADDIEQTNAHADETLRHVIARVEASADSLEQMYAEIDAAEVEAEEAVDTLLLTEIEVIATEQLEPEEVE